MAKEKIQALVDGGKASAGPPLGPKLGPLGVNVQQIIADINKATKDFEGIKVPIDLIVDVESKTWEIKVGSPPTSQLIFKEINLERGSGSSWKEGTTKGGTESAPGEPVPPIAGDISGEKIVKIAKMKKEVIGAKDLKSAVKTVIGTCLSSGITIDGKNPKETQVEVDEGKWDELIK